MNKCRSSRWEIIGAAAGVAVTGGVAIGAAVAAQDSTEAPPVTAATPFPSPERALQQAGLRKVTPDEVASRAEFGRLRVVPAGESAHWDDTFVPQAKTELGESTTRSTSQAELQQVGYAWANIVPPNGYSVVENQLDVKRGSDGSEQAVGGGFTLTSPDARFSIDAEVHALKSGETVEINQWDPSTGSSLWVYQTPSGIP